MSVVISVMKAMVSVVCHDVSCVSYDVVMSIVMSLMMSVVMLVVK